MKSEAAQQSIESITDQRDHLNVKFQNDWYQENIDVLIELLFLPNMQITIQERIIGADRENIRFNWNNTYYILNFECNSQSCWIEGQDVLSTEKLIHLKSVIGNIQV
ncbi:DUF3630 family protein [Colwellia psychrerythraea]|uniref:DUF3630 family protein n=1 Tax=Colwellia psychrerythraea TaxID=28229 RepID=A0A099L4E9_COLPS|nr:DUF3630 family protein [Colwellia psychrerythraea]KGJ97325.1 Protein of unknown function DUF3630 [Colwellia psychrerythraea]